MPNKSFQQEPGWSQDKQRVQKIFWDQHRNPSKGFPNGRPWWAMCEKQVDGSDAVPVAEMYPITCNMLLLPNGKLEIAARAGVTGNLDDGTVLDSGAVFIKGWDAPWLPEPHYIALATARMQGNKFRINYSRQAQDYREANLAFYRRVNEECAARNYPLVELYGPVTFQVRSIKGIGSPPKSPKIPEAALAGDPWLLGFDREENTPLKRLIERDNGRGAEWVAETEDALAGKAKPVPSLSEFALTPDAIAKALGIDTSDLSAIAEMVNAKRTREAKKQQAKPAEAA